MEYSSDKLKTGGRLVAKFALAVGAAVGVIALARLGYLGGVEAVTPFLKSGISENGTAFLAGLTGGLMGTGIGFGLGSRLLEGAAHLADRIEENTPGINAFLDKSATLCRNLGGATFLAGSAMPVMLAGRMGAEIGQTFLTGALGSIFGMAGYPLGAVAGAAGATLSLAGVAKVAGLLPSEKSDDKPRIAVSLSAPSMA